MKVPTKRGGVQQQSGATPPTAPTPITATQRKQRMLAHFRTAAHVGVVILLVMAAKYPLFSVTGLAVERGVGGGGGEQPLDAERAVETNVQFFSSFVKLASSEPSSSTPPASLSKSSQNRNTNVGNSQPQRYRYDIPECLQYTFMLGRRFLWAGITCASIAGVFTRLSPTTIPLISRKGKVSFLSLVVDLRMPIFFMMAHLFAFTALLLLSTSQCPDSASSSTSSVAGGSPVASVSDHNKHLHSSSSTGKDNAAHFSLPLHQHPSGGGYVDIYFDTKSQKMESGGMYIIFGICWSLAVGIGETLIGCLAIIDNRSSAGGDV